MAAMVGMVGSPGAIAPKSAERPSARSSSAAIARTGIFPGRGHFYLQTVISHRAIRAVLFVPSTTPSEDEIMEESNDEIMEEPSIAEQIATVVSKRGTATFKGVVKTITFRVPVPYLAEVDAMAAEAGNSRNSMLFLLVKAGLEAVKEALPEEVKKAVSERVFAFDQAHQQPDSGEI
jgi:hypothetical protein